MKFGCIFWVELFQDIIFLLINPVYQFLKFGFEINFFDFQYYSNLKHSENHVR